MSSRSIGQRPGRRRSSIGLVQVGELAEAAAAVVRASTGNSEADARATMPPAPPDVIRDSSLLLSMDTAAGAGGSRGDGAGASAGAGGGTAPRGGRGRRSSLAGRRTSLLPAVATEELGALAGFALGPAHVPSTPRLNTHTFASKYVGVGLTLRARVCARRAAQCCVAARATVTWNRTLAPPQVAHTATGPAVSCSILVPQDAGDLRGSAVPAGTAAAVQHDAGPGAARG